MPHVQNGRFTADLSSLGDDVVVFLIGMRINKPWKVHAWWPVFVAMPTMLRHLTEHPEKGLLGYQQAFFPSPMLVQYWRSFEDLQRFARDREDPHLEPWRQFNKRIGSSGDVGIWHETYRVSTANIETIYGNMPPYGLAAATAAVPIRRGRDSAAARIGATNTDDPALPAYYLAPPAPGHGLGDDWLTVPPSGIKDLGERRLREPGPPLVTSGG